MTGRWGLCPIMRRIIIRRCSGLIGLINRATLLPFDHLFKNDSIRIGVGSPPTSAKVAGDRRSEEHRVAGGVIGASHGPKQQAVSQKSQGVGIAAMLGMDSLQA